MGNSTIKNFIMQKEYLILPDIQREFVWNSEQICRLFDSILRGYPIGNFLIWNLKGEDIKEKGIKFYKFLDNYNEFDPINNDEHQGYVNQANYYAILDGQQRTQALLIGLKGYLKLRKYRGQKNNPNAYLKNYLYINLVGRENKDLDYKYEFSFLTDEQAQQDKKNKWLRVDRITNYEKPSAVTSDLLPEFEFESEDDKKLASDILVELFEKINKDDKLISWYEINTKTDIEDVLDIFVRTNSGGTALTKTDLLFSTIVSQWNGGRDKIENLIDKINNKNNLGIKFRFQKDFVMRSILYFLDKPIDMKVKNFKDNIKDIQDYWDEIENSLIKMSDLLKEIGFCDDNIIAYNAAMPIGYYIYKSGILNDNTKSELKKYFIVAQLKNLYGVASNSTLNSIRNELTNKTKKDNKIILKLKDRKFSYNQLKNVKIIGDRNFEVDEDSMEPWFDKNKGAYTFMVLTLLYPNVKVATEEFHQDHMHPDKLLEEIPQFKNYRNKLANLQLLEEKENEHKSKTPLKEWLDEDKNRYNDELLPKGISYDINNYFEFLEKRKELMKKKLIDILNIK